MLAFGACDQKPETRTSERRASSSTLKSISAAPDEARLLTSSKHSFAAYLASRGYPLREVPHDSNYIDHFFSVGPTYEYAIGVNFLDSKKERFDPLQYSIPSWKHNGIVLWFWNMDTNGTPGYKEFFDEFRSIVEQYDAGSAR
ncbi:MAG: hypothetical protein MI861_17345 [Pirellulales bacterium]|nr:hypothetical protein [Pirellulales bacterium]